MEFELQIKNTVVFTSFHLENVRLCIGVNSDGNGFNFFEAPEFDKIVRHNLRIEIGQRHKPTHGISSSVRIDGDKNISHTRALLSARARKCKLIPGDVAQRSRAAQLTLCT